MIKHPTALTLLLLLPALLSGCGKSKPAEAAAATSLRPLTIRTLPAAERVFERRLTVQGTLEAKNYANVAARMEGNLDRIWVDEGDSVKAGETTLFQIDPVGRRNALAIAEQVLAVAQASLAVAQANSEKAAAEARKAGLDFERYGRLHAQKTITENEFEKFDTLNLQAQAGLHVAQAQVDLAGRQVKQAEAALAIARKNLDDSLVVAPISGVVSMRNAEPGEHMALGRIVLRIDDLGAIEAAAFLPALYHPEVEPGKTLFRLGVNGRDGGTNTVTYRSPTINPSLRTFEIKGLVDASSGLAVPGSMADLTLIFETRRHLGVPTASILVRAGKAIVFTAQDGKARQVEVATGWQNDEWTEILSGLEPGQPVVTEGQTQLRDGSAVDIL
jgi:RND family efflux transporter MFP subunit